MLSFKMHCHHDIGVVAQPVLHSPCERACSRGLVVPLADNAELTTQTLIQVCRSYMEQHGLDVVVPLPELSLQALLSVLNVAGAVRSEEWVCLLSTPAKSTHRDRLHTAMLTLTASQAGEKQAARSGGTGRK